MMVLEPSRLALPARDVDSRQLLSTRWFRFTYEGLLLVSVPLGTASNGLSNLRALRDLTMFHARATPLPGAVCGGGLGAA